MAHLGSFRKGWQSENLARYILHRFSFVSHPATIADDVGSDFFCTLFETAKVGRNSFLLPRNSFAIQIKSSPDSIDFSKKRRYLERLEIPFFVGVVNRDKLRLTIHSGEYIPAFFSYKGIPEGLQLEFCERSQIAGCDHDYFREIGQDSYVLKFPKIVEIDATDGDEDLGRKSPSGPALS